MKLLFLFFSGTGNTQFISEYLKDQLLESNKIANLEITLAAIEWADKKIVNDYDIICLGYPVYAGLAPSLVREFILEVPEVQTKGLFVYNTKGIAEGIANWQTISLLEKKGYKPLGFSSFIMPASDEISMLLKKDSRIFKKMVNKDFRKIKKADKLANRMIKAIEQLQSNKSFDALPRKKPVKIFGFIITWFLLGLYTIIGNAMAKKLRADENCTSCGICVAECPTKNIILDDAGITFDDHCIFCLRCINNCPEEAIQIGNLSVGKARWHGPESNYKSSKYKSPKTFK